jgi:YYY domain-containing protein
MIAFLSWYLTLTLAGLIALPLAYRLLPGLSDRGFAFVRPLGLILWGFIFWLLTSLHILQNDAGGIVLALLILAGLSAWSLWGGRVRELMAWLKSQRAAIITVELLFLLAFVAWTVVRSADPNITGTEKPMDLAFINAIQRSPAFPANDPWLSGYAISYYYFGHLIVAMISAFSGVYTGIGFNLGISSWFALSAVAVYGLVYNLLAAWGRRRVLEGITGGGSPHLAALLGPFFLLIVSNLEGFLETLHARGIFWQQAADGTWTSGFWRWLNMPELCQPPTTPFGWLPERMAGIWWWRASRVIQDFDMGLVSQIQAGTQCVTGKEIIDEFPFFSYYLADLHPHVLSMPFVLLAAALALNLYTITQAEPPGGEGVIGWIGRWWNNESPRFSEISLWRWLRTPFFWLAAVVMGGLAFLNTWDFPIYVGLLSAAYTLARFQQAGWNSRRIWDFLEMGLATGIAGVLLYLPFYIGFDSQAGGVIPSLSFYTRGVYFWIMFGSLLLPVLAWMIYLAASRRERLDRARWVQGIKFGAALVGGFWLLSLLYSTLALSLPALGSLLANASPGLADQGAGLQMLGNLFFNLQYGSAVVSPGDNYSVLWVSTLRRLADPGTWLTLLLMFVVGWALLGSSRLRTDTALTEESAPVVRPAVASPDGFVLLMVLAAAGLVLVPEFFYLRDQFGWRMNTIFKLYYQAWILWSAAAAFAVVVVWQSLRGVWSAVFRVVLGLVLLMALAYPAFGVYMRLSGTDPSNWTVDGTRHLTLYNPEEMSAIQWLRSAPPGTVSEAVGGSYTSYARVSTHSGQPTVLGWPGHESQWRGGAEEMGSRESDIQRLYETSNWYEALEILRQYDIRYVFVGRLERSTYRLEETKFQQFLQPVFTEESVTVYGVPNLDEISELIEQEQ